MKLAILTLICTMLCICKGANIHKRKHNGISKRADEPWLKYPHTDPVTAEKLPELIKDLNRIFMNPTGDLTDLDKLVNVPDGYPPASVLYGGISSPPTHPGIEPLQVLQVQQQPPLQMNYDPLSLKGGLNPLQMGGLQSQLQYSGMVQDPLQNSIVLQNPLQSSILQNPLQSTILQNPVQGSILQSSSSILQNPLQSSILQNPLQGSLQNYLQTSGIFQNPIQDGIVLNSQQDIMNPLKDTSQQILQLQIDPSQTQSYQAQIPGFQSSLNTLQNNIQIPGKEIFHVIQPTNTLQSHTIPSLQTLQTVEPQSINTATITALHQPDSSNLQSSLKSTLDNLFKLIESISNKIEPSNNSPSATNPSNFKQSTTNEDEMKNTIQRIKDLLESSTQSSKAKKESTPLEAKVNCNCIENCPCSKYDKINVQPVERQINFKKTTMTGLKK